MLEVATILDLGRISGCIGGGTHIENSLVQLIFDVTDESLGVVVFGARLKELCESNQDADIEYLVVLLLPLKFVENVSHGEGCAGFGHDEAPDTHRKHIANLAQINLASLLVNILVKLRLLSELIRKILHGLERLHSCLSLLP